MKKHLCLLLLPLLSGCAHFTVSQTGFDVASQTTFTNYATGDFFLATAAVGKLDIISRNKNGARLLGAQNSSLTGDVDTIKALGDAFGQVAAAAAKGAAKP